MFVYIPNVKQVYLSIFCIHNIYAYAIVHKVKDITIGIFKLYFLIKCLTIFFQFNTMQILRLSVITLKILTIYKIHKQET